MAPVPVSVNMYQIQVSFNPAALQPDSTLPLFTFSGDIDPAERTISVPQGISLLVFNLSTEGGPPIANFQSNPTQWFEGTAPINTPQSFIVQWFTPTHFTIIDFNSARWQQPHDFNIVVVYGSQTYGSDPKIINEPPVG